MIAATLRADPDAECHISGHRLGAEYEFHIRIDWTKLPTEVLPPLTSDPKGPDRTPDYAYMNEPLLFPEDPETPLVDTS